MELHITGKNFELTEAIKQYATDKVEHAARITSDIIDVRLVLEHTRDNHAEAYHVSFNLQAGHDHLHGNVTASDLYVALDAAKDELDRLLRDRKSTYEAKHRQANATQRDAKLSQNIE